MSKIDKAIEYAEQLGREHGTNAAAWWEQDAIGGRNTRPAAERGQAAQRVLDGIEDGDPAVLDELPEPDLSGQWADDMSGSQLVADALEHAGIPHHPEDPTAAVPDDSYREEICDAYDSAFHSAVQDAVSAACQKVLS